MGLVLVVHFVTWGSDGQVVGYTLGIRGTLWRFHDEGLAR